MTYTGFTEITPEEMPPLPHLDNKKRWWPVPLAFTVGIIVGAGVAIPVTMAAAGQFDTGRDAINEAVSVCGGQIAGIRILDDGQAVSFDTKGTDDISGATYIDVICILNNLDIPDSVVANMDNTRALDGKQTDSWDGYSITWSYHPDTGMSGVVTAD